MTKCEWVLRNGDGKTCGYKRAATIKSNGWNDISFCLHHMGMWIVRVARAEGAANVNYGRYSVETVQNDS